MGAFSEVVLAGLEVIRIVTESIERARTMTDAERAELVLTLEAKKSSFRAKLDQLKR